MIRLVYFSLVGITMMHCTNNVFAQIAPGPVTINTCCKECKPCRKAKVVTKTVIKTVIKEVPVDRVVEKVVEKTITIEAPKNSLSLVLGRGIDRVRITEIRTGYYEIQPDQVNLVGARYTRDIDAFVIGAEAFTSYNRLNNYNSVIETGTVSLGLRF